MNAINKLKVFIQDQFLFWDFGHVLKISDIQSIVIKQSNAKNYRTHQKINQIIKCKLYLIQRLDIKEKFTVFVLKAIYSLKNFPVRFWWHLAKGIFIEVQDYKKIFEKVDGLRKTELAVISQ